MLNFDQFIGKRISFKNNLVPLKGGADYVELKEDNLDPIISDLKSLYPEFEITIMLPGTARAMILMPQTLFVWLDESFTIKEITWDQ